jgi:hypothetical protein
LQQYIQNVFDGSQPLQLTVKLNNNNDNNNANNEGILEATSTSMNNNMPSSSSGISESHNEQRPSNITTTTSSSLNTENDANVLHSTTAIMTSAALSLPFENGVPVYKMSRQVSNVHDLYNEWTIDRDGFWSIEELEEKWGTRWRRNDRKWFNLRNKIIEAIHDLQ